MNKVQMQEVYIGDDGQEARKKLYDNDKALSDNYDELYDYVTTGYAKKTEVSVGTILKGDKANEAEIKAVIDPSKGDTYRAIDTGHYWTYGGTQWNNLGILIPANAATYDDLAKKAPITAPLLKYANGNKAVEVGTDNIVKMYDSDGNIIFTTKYSAATPAAVMQNGNSQIVMFKTGTCYNYDSGMYAVSMSVNGNPFIKKGLRLYYPVTEGTEPVAMLFDGFTADSKQLQLLTKSGKEVLNIDNNEKLNFNSQMLAQAQGQSETIPVSQKLFTDQITGKAPLANPILKYANGSKAVEVGTDNIVKMYDSDGNIIFTTKYSAATPAAVMQNGNSQIVMFKDGTSYNYDSGMYAVSMSVSGNKFYGKGLRLYYPVTEGTEPVAMVFDASTADAKQMQLLTKSGKEVLNIDKNEKLNITGLDLDPMRRYSGKKILSIGDSLMTGYPQTNMDVLPLAKLDEYGYPNIVCQRIGATPINNAMPGAVIRISAQDGSALTGVAASRSLGRTIAEAERLFPDEGPDRERAKKFSYENSVLPYVNDACIICFAFGANDVEVDKLDNTTWLPESEFNLFDANDPYNTGKFPINSRDRKSFIGATNHVIDEILKINPKAYICFIGHPTADDAQHNSDQHARLNRIVKALADYWGAPLLELWEKTGWINKDGNNTLQTYCPDGIHFASDKSKAGLNKVVNAVEKFLLYEVLEN